LLRLEDFRGLLSVIREPFLAEGLYRMCQHVIETIEAYARSSWSKCARTDMRVNIDDAVPDRSVLDSRYACVSSFRQTNR